MSDKSASNDQAKQIADLQRRLDDITRLVSDWVWEIDKDLRLVYISHRIFELLGLHPFQVEGKTFSELGRFKAWDGSDSEPRWQSPFRDVEFETADRSGNLHYFLISGLPVYDSETGAFCGVRGTAEDVTQKRNVEADLRRSYEEMEQRVEERTRELSQEIQERKKIETALRSSEAIAQHENSEKTKMLRQVSHELRTALNVVAGFSESMQKELFGSVENRRYKEYVDDILASSRQLQEMISRFADITSKGAVIEVGKVGAKHKIGIESVLQHLSDRIEEGGISVEVDLDSASCELAVEQDRLEQMLLSLVLYIVRHLPPNDRLSIKDVDGEGDVVTSFSSAQLVLSDTELRIALEEPMGGSYSWLFNAGDGIGADLFVVGQWASAMGGSLEITSSENEGSCFSLKLPKLPVLTDLRE